MLCSGTFQHHLVHGTLDYLEVADVAEVEKKYTLCPEALQVLQSAEYQRHFDDDHYVWDRSVFTFRKIEHHFSKCPELVSWPEGGGLAVSTEEVASSEMRSRRGKNSGAPLVMTQSGGGRAQQEDASRASGAAHPPGGVWAPPQDVKNEQAVDVELGGARGDRQHDVIPRARRPRPEEGGPTQQLQEERAGKRRKSQDCHTPQLEGRPLTPEDDPTQQLQQEPAAKRRKTQPPLPQQPQPPPPVENAQDDAVSPENVSHTVAQQQALDAGKHMEFYYEMFQQLQDLLTTCDPAHQSGIKQSMKEITAKLRDNASIQIIAKCRLEVTAPLYLIFKMMIQVM